MNTHELLLDAFARIGDDLPRLLEGLDARALAERPGGSANPIGWLVWHLTRVEDNHLAELAKSLGIGDGRELWSQGWRERLALPYDEDATGYAMSAEDVARFGGVTAEQLLGYHAAVHEATTQILARLADGDLEAALDTVVDEQWDPPVTAGVRLVSVVNDLTQHMGQAGYAKGLLATH